MIFIGTALAGELVWGSPSTKVRARIVRFCGRDLGVIDRDRRFRSFAPPRARLRVAAEPTVTPEQ